MRLPHSWEDEACPPHPPAGPQLALQACLCAEAPPGGAGSPGHRSPCKGLEAFLFQGRSFLTVNPSQALRDGAPGMRPRAARCPKWRKSPEPVTFSRWKLRGRASQGGDSGTSSARKMLTRLSSPRAGVEGQGSEGAGWRSMRGPCTSRLY